MDPNLLFTIANNIALLCWIFLLVFPFSKRLKIFYTSIIITSFSILYFSIILPSFNGSSLESFNSLAGISELFNDPLGLLAGWIHYLAFDLMVGMYICKNAEKYGINRWLLIPCLLFTFMLGPIGLLLYFIIRIAYTKRYFHTY